MSLHDSVLPVKKVPGMVSCYFFKSVKWMFGAFWEKAKKLKENKSLNSFFLIKFV